MDGSNVEYMAMSECSRFLQKKWRVIAADNADADTYVELLHLPWEKRYESYHIVFVFPFSHLSVISLHSAVAFFSLMPL